MKKDNLEITIEKLLKEFWMLYIDWIPTDKGKFKKQIDDNKLGLLKLIIAKS